MNIVRRFFQGEPVDSIERAIMIPQGQLFLVRSPNSPKSENECLYSDEVVLSLKDHVLVVWKPEEGDEDEEDEDGAAEEDDDAQFADTNILETFDVKDNSLICLFERHQQQIITWRDLEGDFGDMYEYRVSPCVSHETVHQFLLAVYRCLYELKYNRSGEGVKMKDLQEFVVKRSDIELYMVPATIESDTDLGGANNSDEDDDDDDDDDFFVDANETLESKARNGETLNRIPCELSVFSDAKNGFRVTNTGCQAVVLKLDDWKYMLEVVDTDRGEVVVQIFINEDMYPEFQLGADAFVFNQITLRGVHTWRVLFDDKTLYDTFKVAITRALWETKNRDVFPVQEEEYLADTFDAMDIDDVPLDDFDNEPNEESPKRDYKYNVSKDLPSEDEGEYNSGLRVGLTTDRAFVSRGDKLGVFKADDELEFVTSIQNIASKSGETVHADRMMLMNGDSTMVLQDSNSPNILHQLDLEKGKVVQDWSMSKNGVNSDIKVFTTNAKLSGTSHEDTFLGATSQALFRVDQRMREGFISNEEFKEYKTKLGITAITTTLNGMVAIATKDGSIKLYDAVGKNAKTALPPLGDPIVSLDVTLNGRFMVATCNKYLLLIDLKIKNGRNEGQLGFNKPFPADSKPMPGRLRLEPGHMASLMRLYGKDIEFTPAKFDLGSRTIISSVGRYSFIWDVQAALRGNQYPSKIREYADKVVVGDFAQHVDQVVVALKNDVALTSRNAYDDPHWAFSSN